LTQNIYQKALQFLQWSNSEEALSDESLKKSNGDEALNDDLS
jgi:hypothetical protein